MDKKLKNLTFTALLAAMITIFTAYICHIPVGSNGGYIHFGDSLIYIAASLLPWPYAMAAAAIGGGLADILTAPIWAPATIIIKALISIPFTNKSSKIVTAGNVISTIIAFVILFNSYSSIIRNLYCYISICCTDFCIIRKCFIICLNLF